VPLSPETAGQASWSDSLDQALVWLLAAQDVSLAERLPRRLGVKLRVDVRTSGPPRGCRRVAGRTPLCAHRSAPVQAATPDVSS
jgi:hypothetical protein